MSIHDELHRIAERAPVVTVPDDVWTRGRRARTRDRAIVVAGALAVALVAAVLVWVPTRSEPPVADTDSLGVPDRLWAVPERMSDRNNDDTWMRDEVSGDLAIGTAAAAWLADGGLPVLVDAAAGGYHLLDLPDFAGNNGLVGRMDKPALALSPDGGRLAYAYAVFGSDADSAPIPSGIRVVDLIDGSVVREIPVPGREGTLISQLEWSPDGTWLAFAGTPQDTWTMMSLGSRGGAVLGRIAASADQAQVRPVGNDQLPLRVSNRGVVTFEYGMQRRWNGDTTITVPHEPDPWFDRWLGRTADGAPVRVADRVGSAAQAVETTPGAVKIVLDDGIDDTLSLATALMTERQPTVSRPEPDWPWSDERKLVVGLILAAGAAMLLALLLRLTRRSRR